MHNKLNKKLFCLFIIEKRNKFKKRKKRIYYGNKRAYRENYHSRKYRYH